MENYNKFTVSFKFTDLSLSDSDLSNLENILISGILLFDIKKIDIQKLINKENFKIEFINKKLLQELMSKIVEFIDNNNLNKLQITIIASNDNDFEKYNFNSIKNIKVNFEDSSLLIEF